MKCSPAASGIAVSMGPTDDVGGSPGTWPGTIFKHGLTCSLPGTERGVGDSIRSLGFVGPQQQDSPIQILPHPQWRACSSASKLAAWTSDDAATSPVRPKANTNMAAGNNQRRVTLNQERGGQGVKCDCFRDAANRQEAIPGAHTLCRQHYPARQGSSQFRGPVATESLRGW